MLRGADFGKLLFVDVFGEMCVFVSRRMKIATGLQKNGDAQNKLLIFYEKETHSETKLWKSSRILRVSVCMSTCVNYPLKNA